MSSDHAFTVRVSSKVLKLLDRLASNLDRSRNYVVSQALEEYIDLQSWQIQKIKSGIKAADRGELIDHEEVMNNMESVLKAKKS